MANRIFRGDAVPIAQVVKITPSNPEVGDTFTIRINGKEVRFVATDTLVSTIVDGLVAAWNTAPFPEPGLITANGVDADGDGKNDYLKLKAHNRGVPFRVEREAADAGGFAIIVSTVITGDPGQNEKQRAGAHLRMRWSKHPGVNSRCSSIPTDQRRSWLERAMTQR